MIFENLKKEFKDNNNNILNNQEAYFVDLFFGMMETYLKQRGITFYSDSSTARSEFYPFFSQSQTIFYLREYITQDNISEVKIDYLHCGEKKEEVITDYILLRKLNCEPYPYKGLELPKNGVNLTITGIWGLSNALPNDLKFTIYSLALEILNLYKAENQKTKSDGQELSSLKIDEITYNFRGGSNYNQRGGSKTNLSNLKAFFENNSTLQEVLINYV